MRNPLPGGLKKLKHHCKTLAAVTMRKNMNTDLALDNFALRQEYLEEAPMTPKASVLAHAREGRMPSLRRPVPF